MITVTINGKPRQFAAALPLPELLKELGIDTRLIAVAHNGVVVRRQDHERVVVQDGDTLEIVHIVGGGSG